MSELKPCPFCGASGRTALIFQYNEEEAYITCKCGARFKAKTKPEKFEQIEGNIYRKIPRVLAEDVARDGWNRRTNE